MTSRTALIALMLCSLGCRKGSVTLDTGDVGTPVELEEVPAPSLTVTPASIDLGLVFVGQLIETPLTLENVGDDAGNALLVVSGQAASSYLLDVAEAALEPGATSDHVLTFAPGAWGEVLTAEVVITETSVGEQELRVAITASVQIDSDGDGFGSPETGGEDCDDADDTTYPGAEDTWYDGVDSDCAGNDDYDQDADGHTANTEGSEDCDDTDATIHPEAEDAWYDGIDSDCAGNDDYDQDGDGHSSDDHDGDDCDDEDATINPSETETWYDGIDSDCAGDDDYDQDADGHSSDDYEGDDCDDTDADINPSATDTWYDGVDSDCAGDDDYDQDADGVHVDDDCDDQDASAGEPTDETLDGTDEDCNGLVDDMAISDAASGILYGYESSMAVGNSGQLAMVEDITGDGAVDLVVVSDEDDGYAWVVDGSTASTANDDLDDVDTALIEGTSSTYSIRRVIGPGGDEDGDGTVDLILGTGSSYYARTYLFAGGGDLSGGMDTGDRTARFTGDSSYDGLGVSALGDIDGDGNADVVTGARYDSDGYTSYTGNVAVFEGGSLSGSLDLGDADDQIHGTSSRDYLGSSLMIADLDDDGYADIIAGAPGDDDGGSSAGAVYIFMGNSSLSFSDEADDAAGTKIEGDSSGDALGTDPIPMAGDVDGDGDLDLLIASENEGSAWLFFDAGSLSSSLEAGDADHDFTGDSGDFATSAVIDSDLNDDGLDDVVLGGDSSDTNGSDSGVIWMYQYDSGWSTSLDDGDANATLWGDDSSDYLGTAMAGGMDVNGDGIEDIIVGAVGVDTGASGGGAVYIIPGW